MGSSSTKKLTLLIQVLAGPWTEWSAEFALRWVVRSLFASVRSRTPRSSRIPDPFFAFAPLLVQSGRNGPDSSHVCGPPSNPCGSLCTAVGFQEAHAHSHFVDQSVARE